MHEEQHVPALPVSHVYYICTQYNKKIIEHTEKTIIIHSTHLALTHINTHFLTLIPVADHLYRESLKDHCQGDSLRAASASGK